MVKAILTFIKDSLLFLAIVALMIGGVFGVRLPYRPLFTDTGAYQLEVFETGLSFYHFGRGVTPFYDLSPLNDYYVSQGVRSALLAKEAYDAKDFTAIFNREKPDALIDSVKAFTGRLKPWYHLETGGLTAQYTTQKTGNQITIYRTLNMDQTLPITEQGITVWYDPNDVVFDLKSYEVYTAADEILVNQINRYYGFNLAPKLEEEFSTIQTSGAVGIINPTRPGWLKVTASPNQRLVLNRRYWLIEVIESVTRPTDTLTTSISLTGYQTGEKP